MNRSISAFTLFLAITFTTIIAYGQDASVQDNELDKWRGCSLGIRLENKDGNSFVSAVRSYAADKTELKEGDQVVKVGDLEISSDNRQELAKLLGELSPDNTINVVVIRDGEEKEIKATTFKAPLVDIAQINRMLSSNRLIKRRLEELERPDFMDTFESRLVDAVEKSKSPREAYEKMNRIIDEVDVSHTAFLPDITYTQLLRGQGADAGYTLQRHQIGGRSGYYVVDIKPGTVGFKNQIQLGDNIVAINGVRIEDSRRLILAGEEDRHNLFSIRADEETKLTLDYLASPFDEIRSLEVTPGKSVTTGDALTASATVLKADGKSFGYVRCWNLMSFQVPDRISKLLEGDFSGCDALIVDLRGRGGSVQVVLRMDRLIKNCGKPVVAITDGLTRSAKEMLSYRIKKHDNVTVVGMRTTGAVTGATFAQLPSGNALMYPVLSADNLKRYLDDNVLERNGVFPDEEINFFIPYCNGRDRMLEAAIERASNKASKAR